MFVCMHLYLSNSSTGSLTFMKYWKIINTKPTQKIGSKTLEFDKYAIIT